MYKTTKGLNRTPTSGGNITLFNEQKNRLFFSNVKKDIGYLNDERSTNKKNAKKKEFANSFRISYTHTIPKVKIYVSLVFAFHKK